MHSKNKSLKRFLKKLIPNFILLKNFESKYNTILFTFDDGPHPTYTAEILKTLDTHGIKACFFCVGKYAELYPELIIEIRERGHVIGNHTYNHKNVSYTSRKELYKDIEKCQNVLFDILGEKPYLFRPPRGKVSIDTIIAARELKLKTVLWSLGGGEWSINKNRKSTYIANRLLRSLNSGDILLFHDNHPKIIKVLNIIIPDILDLQFDLKSGVDLLYGFQKIK